MRNSIRTRLTIAFIGLAIVPLLSVGLVLGWWGFSVWQEQAINSQREVAQRISTQVVAFIQTLESDLWMVIQVRGLQGLNREQKRAVLAELHAYQDAFEELVLLDDQGQEQIRLSRLETVSAADLGERSQADEFTIPKASGEAYYGRVWFDKVTGEPLITIAVPIIDVRSGLVDGVLVADVRVKKIWDLIANTRVGKGGSAYILDAQGRVVAHRNPSVVLRNVHFDAPDQDGIHTGLGGTNVVLTTDRIRFGEQAFDIVIERPVSEALAPVINTALIIAVLIFVVLIIAIGLGLLTVRWIVRPIEMLAATAQAIRAGDLSQQAEVTSHDEIGALAYAFNDMTAQLRELIGGLERRVEERTAELERRSAQLEAAAQVAGEAAGIQDVEKLLEETVRLISDRFGFYHAGIFLLDETREYAVLRAASSGGGQRMLDRAHRLRVGEEGIVGYVTGQGEPRIAFDVGADAVFFDNPDLPDTRSEMALPLRARGEVIGALDVQTREPEAFGKEDVAALRTLADQVAMAISNARLFQQAQESLEAEQWAYGELSGEAWRELLRARPDLGQRYDPQGILATDRRWREEMKLAVREGKTVLSDDGASATLATPIKVRDQVIGVLDAHKPAGAGEWTAEEVALIETLTEQLSLALESARLYQETQRRAARERLTGQIAARMRETLDVDGVLQAAVRQMGEALGLHDVTIQLEVDVDQTN